MEQSSGRADNIMATPSEATPSEATPSEATPSGATSSNADEDLANFDTWDPMSDDYRSARNTLTISDKSEPMAVITGRVQPISSKLGNVTICERFATLGECADGRYCDKVHVDREARDKIWTLQSTYECNKGRTCLNFTYLSPIDIEPDPEALLLATVTSVKSPVDFYIVAPYENLNFAYFDSEDLDFYVGRIQQTSNIKTKLQKCHEQLARLFDNPFRIDNLNDEIYLSQIVACKLKDGLFRRAMVTGLPDPADYEDIHYTLFLIDVGVEVELPRELIYDIKANCLSEPPMALNCRLDIKPAKGTLKWSEGALVQFNNMVKQNRFFLCRVIKHIKADRILTVDLVDLKTRASLTFKMLSSGLAEKCAF